MESEAESLCCLITNEVSDEYFEGYYQLYYQLYYNIKYTTIKYTIKNSLFSGNKYVTLSEDVKTVCLTKNVLKTALSALNDLRGNNLTDTSDCAYRYDGYKQYTCWVHENLGKGVRKVIPLCAVWPIRNNYPPKDGEYIPFMKSKEGEKRLVVEN